ncbi:hypothetical protein KR074_007502, partial [Drosophila pseudoananassae]
CSSGYPFLPYPSDCRKFIQCSGDVEYILDCPPTLYWDYKNLACVPDTSGCYSDEGIHEKPEENVCSGGATYLPDPSDCTKFIQCNHGQPIYLQCSKPLYWNPVTNSCGWSDEYCQ